MSDEYMRNNLYNQQSIINKVKCTVRIIVAFSFVLLGGIIYLTYRSRNLLMFQWIEVIGITDIIEPIRQYGQTISIPQWIKYSLPDGLWLLSYLMIIDIIWYNTPTNTSKNYWISILPLTAIGSEIIQLLIPYIGTFDIIDLLCYINAIILYYFLKT